jgi:hypothetical protein
LHAAMSLSVLKRLARIGLCASLSIPVYCFMPPSSSRTAPKPGPSARNGTCTVSAAYICQKTHGPKLSVGHALAEQMNSRLEFLSLVYGPQSKLLAEARCEVDPQSKAVRHSALVSRSALEDEDVDFLRKAGLCEEP